MRNGFLKMNNLMDSIVLSFQPTPSPSKEGKACVDCCLDPSYVGMTIACIILLLNEHAICSKITGLIRAGQLRF